MQEQTAFESEFTEVRLTFKLRISVPVHQNPHTIDGVMGAVEQALKAYVNDHNMAAGSILSSVEKLN